MSLAEKIHEGLQKHLRKEESKASKGAAKHADKGNEGKHSIAGNEVIPKGHHATHFDVHVADGGFMVHTHHEKNRDKNTMGENMEYYNSPHKSVHKTLKSVYEHMKTNCEEADTGHVAGTEKPNMKSQNRLN